MIRPNGHNYSRKATSTISTIVCSSHVCISYVVFLVSMLLLSTSVINGVNAQQGSNSATIPFVIAPPDSRPQGFTYGDWGAKWWQWAYGIPSSINPLFDETGERCSTAQNGTVWFLVGTQGGSVVRQCTVPQGTSLFFPLANTMCTIAGGDAKTPEELDECATGLINQVTSLKLEIDGVKLQDQELRKYRAQSTVFTLNMPKEDNMLGINVNSTPFVAEGYWIFLEPLPSGNHEIRFGGTVGDPTLTTGVNFVTEATYHLTVSNSTTTAPAVTNTTTASTGQPSNTTTPTNATTTITNATNQ
jgi:hypothetical protein